MLFYTALWLLFALLSLPKNNKCACVWCRWGTLLCWCTHVYNYWTGLWSWRCYFPFVVQAQPSSLLHSVYWGNLWVICRIICKIQALMWWSFTFSPSISRVHLILKGFLHVWQICIMLCADHGPCVSGAHNSIVTARAGKDLVSSLVSGECV
jgi:hypothetical protein